MTLTSAAAYRRVSTKEQDDRGRSPESQAKYIADLARLHNYCIPPEYDFFEDVSGKTPIRERGAGGQLYRLLLSGAVRVLLIDQIDRLSRDHIDLLIIIRDLLKAGVKIHSVEIGEVTSDRDIGLVIKAWQASEEHAKILERTYRGRVQKANAGTPVGSGNAPYPFDRVWLGKVSRFEINPDRAAIVGRMIDWYLGREGEPLSLKQIGARLNDLKVPAPMAGQTRSVRRPDRERITIKTTGLWTSKSVWCVLKNPALRGLFVWGGIPVEAPDLALIDEATWQAVQDKMEQNRDKAKRNRKYDYALARRLWCTCERRMMGIVSGQEPHAYFYYRCAQTTYYRASRTCPVHSLPAPLVEPKVWALVLSRLDDDILSDGIKELQAWNAARPDESKKRLAEIEAANAADQALLDGLLRQFGDSHSPALIAARTAQVEEASARIDERAGERARLLTEVQQRDRRSARAGARNVIEELRKVRYNLDHATAAQQAQIYEVINLSAVLRFGDEGRRGVVVSSDIFPPHEVWLDE